MKQSPKLRFLSRAIALVFLAIILASFLLFIFFPASDVRNVIEDKNPGTALDLKKLPAFTMIAIVTAEDERFFVHHGLDLAAIKKSFFEAVSNGAAPKGASTITQQVIKNIYLHAERAYLRKLVEVIGALRIDFEYDKKEILEAYLKIAEFGPSIYGLSKASEFYFGRKYSELTLMQSVFLASLLPAPNALNRAEECHNFETHFKKLWYRVGTATLVATDVPVFQSGRRSAFDAVNILRGTAISQIQSTLTNQPDFSLKILADMKVPELVMQLEMLATQFSEAADALPCMETTKSLMRSAKDWAALSKKVG